MAKGATKDVVSKEETKKAAEENPQETPKFKEVEDKCDFLEAEWSKGLRGAYSPTAEACIECERDFTASAEACKYNTELQDKLGKKKKADKPKGGSKGRTSTLLGSTIGSAASRLDEALLKGATMDELKAIRGAVSSHFAHLIRLGHTVVKVDGKYKAFPAGTPKENIPLPDAKPPKKEAKKEEAPKKEEEAPKKEVAKATPKKEAAKATPKKEAAKATPKKEAAKATPKKEEEAQKKEEEAPKKEEEAPKKEAAKATPKKSKK